MDNLCVACYRLITLNVVTTLPGHHCNSLLVLLDELKYLSNFQLFALSAFVLSLSRDKKCSGLYMTPGNVAMILAITLAVSLMVGCTLFSKGIKCEHQGPFLG